MSRIARRTFIKTVALSAAATVLPGRGQSAIGPSAEDPLSPTDPLELWYDQPATRWLDALPIGNGSLGAMVFGGGEDGSPTGELLQLNDDTLWSGRPHDGNNRSAPAVLPQVRAAVLEQQDYSLADRLVRQMQGLHAEAYQPLGNLRIAFDHAAPVSGYRRSLDLDQAAAFTSYRCAETRFQRESFVSFPDQVLVVHVRADGSDPLNCTVTLDGALRIGTQPVGNTRLVLTGKAAAHVIGAGHPGSEHPIRFSDEPGEGMYLAVALEVRQTGGTLTLAGGSLRVAGAREVTLLLTSATGFRGCEFSPDTPLAEVSAAALRKLDSASRKSLAALRAAQRTDHQRLFRRVSLDLGRLETRTPTDCRLANFAGAPDPALLALHFQYGRYLLISSSRDGCQPVNLQGIWNDQTMPPWASNLTTNIDFQMNYWPAETCNLTETTGPLVRFVREVSRTGAVTARETYGLPGWCVHHNVDLWRSANPVGEGVGLPMWANWAMAGPWLCSHLYEHFRFTGDREFLRETAWPLLRGCAEFLLAWLVPDGDGRLTTCPSESTENDFLAPDGTPAMTSAGCTMDMALIRELFGNSLETLKLLQIDDPLAARMRDALPRLIPYQVGKHGQLQEWSVDFDEHSPGQRHLSHLYPLFPGDQIAPRTTPELARAARVSLERRLAAGSGYTGWSRAWAVCCWARLLDGDKAWESLRVLLQHSTNQSLLDTHPAGKGFVFLIDGNLGAPAATAELLLQSHLGSIDLLPALPSAWPTGRVSGLRARGGITVDLAWQNNHAVSATLRADRSGPVLLRAPEKQTIAAVRQESEALALHPQADGAVSVVLPADVACTVGFAPV